MPRWACALVLAALLAGCAAGQRADQKRAAAAAEAAAAAATVQETQVEPQQATTPEVVEPEPEQAPPPENTVARTEPVIDDNPGQVMGLEMPALDALLGRPRLRRVETPAEVWQYAGGDCVMDLFLYPSAESAKDHRVTYYEIRGAHAGHVDPRACFRAILQDAKRAG